MDTVQEIKMRLPIEQLLSQYVQMQKKGRNFVSLCPFHNDSHPSFLISPDKGIAYCFACQNGGDIFSVYQKLEGVDFPQAVKELAEKAGVKVEQLQNRPSVSKDEKQRVRECLEAALAFYRAALPSSALATGYLQRRQVPQEQIDEFEIGVAPDSFSDTYEHLLKSGFSRKEVVAAGLGVQKELKEERIYDRFRNRLMFPIRDGQGLLVGFGGRTLADDDAKYINSSDGILFHKSNILYGLHRAREAIREQKKAILVEGYFDVLACHRVGMNTAVATCGTALTEQHVKLLHRHCDCVVLCMDQDRAGQEAMERSFPLLSREGFHVEAVTLPNKDPSELLASDSDLLRRLLTEQTKPYLDIVIDSLRGAASGSAIDRRKALERLLPLVSAIPFAVERSDYVRKAATIFQTTEAALDQDLQKTKIGPPPAYRRPQNEKPVADTFSSVEITLSLFLFYPMLRSLLSELIEPREGMAAALYHAIKNAPEGPVVELSALDLPDDHRERVNILHLYGEEHGFADWSESLAAREIRKNCHSANRDTLRHKQQEITKRLLSAKAAGNKDDEAALQNEYQEVLKLMKMAS